MSVKHLGVLENGSMQRLKPEGFVDAADCVDDSLSPSHIDTENLARTERDIVLHDQVLSTSRSVEEIHQESVLVSHQRSYSAV